MDSDAHASEKLDGLRRYKDIGWREGNHIFPYEDEPLHEMWLRPLETVARTVAGNPRFPWFDIGDFMIMDGYLRRSRPTLILYKHYYTRRYLNIDESGHTWRYVPPKDWLHSKSYGRYVRHHDLFAAMDHLQLWLLPWMKPGLEHEQRGLDFDDAWQLDPRRAA
jgi:hypothetical protein